MQSRGGVNRKTSLHREGEPVHHVLLLSTTHTHTHTPVQVQQSLQLLSDYRYLTM